jgi:hypothetical protein
MLAAVQLRVGAGCKEFIAHRRTAIRAWPELHAPGKSAALNAALPVPTCASQDPSKRLQGEAVLEELAIDSKALQARLAVQVLITQQQEAERSRRWE